MTKSVVIIVLIKIVVDGFMIDILFLCCHVL